MKGVSGQSSPEDARAEFAAYREEILTRSGHQYTLLGLDLTALTGVAGFVLAQHADVRLLLLLPIVSGSIGLLWYDHARNIDSLGAYIREEMPAFGGYERRIAKLARDEWRRVPMTLALLVLLVGAPISGIVVPFNHVHGALWALWASGLLLSTACTVTLLRWMVAGFRG